MALCECGCRRTTKGGRFKPGHDATLSSRLNRYTKSGTPKQKAYAKRRYEELGWVPGPHPISVQTVSKAS
jgi:hypothetical protein